MNIEIILKAKQSKGRLLYHNNIRKPTRSLLGSQLLKFSNKSSSPKGHTSKFTPQQNKNTWSTKSLQQSEIEKCGGTEADKTALPDATRRNRPHQTKRISQLSIRSF
jgi:hypothetical protein